MKPFEFLFQLQQIELSHINYIDIFSSKLLVILKKGPAKQQILALPLNNSNIEHFQSYYRVIFTHTFTLTQKLTEKEDGLSEYFIKLLFYLQQNKTTQLVGETIFNLSNCALEATQNCRYPLSNTIDKRALLQYSVSAKLLDHLPANSPRPGHTRGASMSKSKSPVLFKSPIKQLLQPKKTRIIKIERNQKRCSKETLQTQDTDQQVLSNMESENPQKDSNQQSSTFSIPDSPYNGYRQIENEGLAKKFQELSSRFSTKKKEEMKQLQDIEKILSREEDELQNQLSKIDEKIKYIKEDPYHSPKATFDEHQNYIAQIATLEEINLRLEQDNDRMKVIIREMSEKIKKFSQSSQMDEVDSYQLILQQKDQKIEALQQTIYEYQKQFELLDDENGHNTQREASNDQMDELKQLIEKLQSELWFSLQLCENQKNDMVVSEERVKELETQLNKLQQPGVKWLRDNYAEATIQKQKGIEQELEKAKQLLNQVMNIIFEIGGKKLIDQITSKLNN